MPTFLIRHITTYRYRSPVAFGEHRLMLRPRDSFDQTVLDHRLTIDPSPADLTLAEDASGNVVGRVRFRRRARELRFEMTCSVTNRPFDPARMRIAEHADTTPFSYGAEEMPELGRYLERQLPDADHRVDAWAREILRGTPGRDTWQFLGRLNATIRHDFAYLRREQPGIQTPAETLSQRQGTCRDFAVLMAEAARAQGIATRFVSGYLHVPSRDGSARQAGGATHAWIQAYLPGAGWIDFDPTSGAIGNRDLVRVAVVREPRNASPLSGSFLGFPNDDLGMEVLVDVQDVTHADPAHADLPSASAAA